MFTGIVATTAEVIEITKKDRFQTHVVKIPAPYHQGLEIGASVAHNGCCLTVTNINGHLISFDLIEETLRLTNLGLLEVGQRINIERAARFGDEIGGHSMSGHIVDVMTVREINQTTENCQIWFDVAPRWTKYILHKGYIGVDGISLTIGDVDEKGFNVNLIPETLERTNLSQRSIGDKINLEIDPQTQAIVDTVERVLANQ
ncbi:riboflavin synthase subunit alpha [Aliivibrio sp. S3MY1]|uniref:riboflavin synthase subunit alpha n=1 Tax=unclassified Aliivibrio TaxID=2645654 RepID=UPI002377D9E7|nr:MULTISPECIES: riboflavin synthase subunit alpha [unclassified Aliivibrio]MDD9194605.1 riboflavin synthase subunit alpha [Aliivibrio sp. S3MY1]MDD9198555.1 riboflavin synthase subunit alpha [Aliivibrio sp. S2MY1]